MFSVRKIYAAHWNRISLIQDLCYPAEAREQVETLQCHWQVAPGFCFVASENEKVVAYLLAHPWQIRVQPPINRHYTNTGIVTNTIFIHDLALHPAIRGKGVGRVLVQQLFEVAAANGYQHFSLISVQGTVGFWAKYGFKIVTDLPENYFNNLEIHYPGGGYFYMEKEIAGG